jgi:hypothetical protein
MDVVVEDFNVLINITAGVAEANRNNSQSKKAVAQSTCETGRPIYERK